MFEIDSKVAKESRPFEMLKDFVELRVVGLFEIFNAAIGVFYEPDRCA